MLLLIGGLCAQSDAQWYLLVQVRFEYEFHDEEGKWFRAHGNEVKRLLLLKKWQMYLRYPRAPVPAASRAAGTSCNLCLYWDAPGGHERL